MRSDYEPVLFQGHTAGAVAGSAALAEGGFPFLAPEPWMAEGLCAETEPEIFFPNKGGSTKAAKDVCAGCDVREQCLAYALARGEHYGIWGGKSERERRAMRGAA